MEFGMKNLSLDPATLVVKHQTEAELRELGARSRVLVPHEKHGDFAPHPSRRDPVELLVEQERLQKREPSLIPLRHGRMMQSPFAFYRGAARIMAHDLKHTPDSGVPHMWICGDAHLCNFGLFASPERALVFDINDFDETFIGPFEWDVKRLATSFVIAGRHNKFSEADTMYACKEMLQHYRKAINEFSRITALELFYKQLPAEKAMSVIYGQDAPESSDEGKKKKKKNKDGKKKGKGKKKHSDSEDAEEDESAASDDRSSKKSKRKKGKHTSEDEDKPKKKKHGKKRSDSDSDNDDDEKEEEQEEDEDCIRSKQLSARSTTHRDTERRRAENTEAMRKVLTGEHAFVAPNAVPWSEKVIRKATSSDHRKMAKELVDNGGDLAFKSEPPLLVPVRELKEHELWGAKSQAEIIEVLNGLRRVYRASLMENRRHLLEQYRMVDLARKVVGVGSVGTRCFAVLLVATDPQDVLILQVKEATRSVLEEVLPIGPKYENHGQRVVTGQRILQATSDVFLGWSGGFDTRFKRCYYWRQMKDMKGGVNVERLSPSGLAQYARICGWTLARAHAKSSNQNGRSIAYYIGNEHETSFDAAIMHFAQRYADLNASDYEKFLQAIQDGRIAAHVA